MVGRITVEYISCRFFLSPGVLLSQPSRHNRGRYWTGNGGRARPITVPGSLPAGAVKIGEGFPAAHKALTAPAPPQKRRSSSELAGRTSGSPGALAIVPSRYLPDLTDAGVYRWEAQCDAPFTDGRISLGRNSLGRGKVGSARQWKQCICMDINYVLSDRLFF